MQWQAAELQAESVSEPGWQLGAGSVWKLDLGQSQGQEKTLGQPLRRSRKCPLYTSD